MFSNPQNTAMSFKQQMTWMIAIIVVAISSSIIVSSLVVSKIMSSQVAQLNNIYALANAQVLANAKSASPARVVTASYATDTPVSCEVPAEEHDVAPNPLPFVPLSHPITKLENPSAEPVAPVSSTYSSTTVNTTNVHTTNNVNDGDIITNDFTKKFVKNVVHKVTNITKNNIHDNVVIVDHSFNTVAIKPSEPDYYEEPAAAPVEDEQEFTTSATDSPALPTRVTTKETAKVDTPQTEQVIVDELVESV